MNRRKLLWLVLALVTVPLLVKDAFAFAPQKGFVFVRTSLVNGAPAPFTQITVTKLSGNYPVPPGPYVTNSVGQIWIALYPGVYRFGVAAGGSTPTYWDVSVASQGEYYIFFTVNGEEM